MSEFEKTLSNEDLITLGFHKLPHFTVGNSLHYQLGRGRYLSVMCIGQGNESMWICSEEEQGLVSDLVCLHNRDYDGFITVEKIKTLIEWFRGDSEKAQQCETSPEPKWSTIKVVCQRCGHYLNGCHCNHFGDQCPHLNTSMFGDNGLAECFNCNKIINKDREVVGDVDDINLNR